MSRFSIILFEQNKPHRAFRFIMLNRHKNPLQTNGSNGTPNYVSQRIQQLRLAGAWAQCGWPVHRDLLGRVVLVSSNTKWRPSQLVRFDYRPVWFRCRADEFSLYFGHCTGKDNFSWGTCSRLRKGREIFVVFPV